MTGYRWQTTDTDVTHAYDLTAHPDLPYVEAPCQYTAMRTALRPPTGGPVCPGCMIAVGMQIPETPDWAM